MNPKKLTEAMLVPPAEVEIVHDPDTPAVVVGGPFTHTERIVRGEPESRWNDFAIGASLLERIRQTCKPGWFLEFGSGVGTRRLAEHFDVISFEHDPEWIIYSPFEDMPIGQVLAPLSGGWYHRVIVKQTLEDAAIQGVKFVGCLIDGPPSLIGREGILQNLDWLAPYLECPIFVDDTHRKAEWKLAADLVHELGRKFTKYDYTDTDKAGCGYSIIETKERGQ